MISFVLCAVIGQALPVAWGEVEYRSPEGTISRLSSHGGVAALPVGGSMGFPVPSSPVVMEAQPVYRSPRRVEWRCGPGGCVPVEVW